MRFEERLGVVHKRIEYFDQHERNYSYHWQDKTGKLLVRWDNSPHHKNIPTFPHHKHTGENIEPSFEITLPDILKVIESGIDK